MSTASLPWQPHGDTSKRPASWSGTAAGDAVVQRVGLRGRDGVLSMLRSALDRADDHHGTAVVVRGEAGSGKSSLLRWAADTAAAAGWRVLQVSGTPENAGLPFAAFRPLVYPVLNTSPDLPESLREALLEAVAGRIGPTDALLAYSALRHVLLSTSRRYPTLVTADNCQELDQASARALVFLANRLTGTRVVLLATTGTDDPSPFADCDATEIGLPGLDEDSARLLLADHHAGLAPTARSAVLATAEGNPLALIDLPSALTYSQYRGQAPLPDPLVPGPRLDAALGPRLRGLPDATRALLAALALTEDGLEAPDLTRLADLLGHGLDALAPAEDAGLLSEARTLRFARRVHRCLAYSTAPVPVRQQAHSAWASLGVSRLDGLADRSGEETPDADRIVPLEALARAAEAGKHWDSAIRALRRAGDLSTLPAEHTRWYAAAAAAALRCGRPHLALTLTLSLGNGPDQVTARTLRIVRASAGFDTGLSAAASHQALSEALTEGPVVGTDVRPWATFQLASLSSLTHRPEPAREALERIARHGTCSDSLEVAVTAQLDPVARVAQIRHLLSAAAERTLKTHGGHDPQELAWLADAAWRIDDTVLGNHLVAAALRHTGPEERAHLQHCQELQAALMVAGGRWAELHELVPARLRDTDTEELTRHTVALKAQLLMVCAYQGRREQADPLLREVRQWARVHGSVHYLRLAGYAAHLLVSAYDGGAQASADHVPLWADDDPAGNVVTRHAHVDVIREALARGDVPAARAHHLRAVRGELDSFSADMTLLVRHGEALLAAHTNAEDAEASFRAAHEAATASTRPFDRARLALDYGVWLRRQRDSSAARTQLRSSHDVFARLEAVPWRDRARAELRATGVRVPGRAPAAPVSGLLFLSAQEQRIARLAATGLSNREIADRLLISPRTVASHLYKVFPRLGVSSRRELAEVLGEFGSSA